MHSKISALFCCMLFLASPHFVFAQFEAYEFEKYTTREGLSENYITSILQDQKGFLWISTPIGLNRFDGIDFKNYYDEGENQFLLSSKIKTLLPFAGDKIGIVGTRGFQLFDPFSFKTKNFIVPDSTSFYAARNDCWDVAQLKNGHYAMTTAAGFYVFNAQQEIVFRYDAYDGKNKANVRTQYGREIFDLDGNNLVIYLIDRELASYNALTNQYAFTRESNSQWSWYHHPPTPGTNHWVTLGEINQGEFVLMAASDSLVYINQTENKRVASPLPFHWEEQFTWRSSFYKLSDTSFALTCGQFGFYLLHFDPVTGQFTFEPDKKLGDFKINCLYLDRDQRLWIGTSDGLFRQKIAKPVIEAFSWPASPEKFYGYTDARRYKGLLYFTRFAKDGGLVIVDPERMEQIRKVTFFDGKDGWNHVLSIEVYYPDTLWLGTDKGALWYDIASGRHDSISSYTATGERVQQLSYLSSPRNGKAVLSSYLGERTVIYDLQQRSFELFSRKASTSAPLYFIKHITYDSYGHIWFGGKGLASWNLADFHMDTSFNVFSGPDQYTDDVISLSADGRGSLWIHTANNGLQKYNIKENSFQYFGMKDGLPSNTIISLSPVVNDQLFICTARHLTRFNTITHEVEIFGNEKDVPKWSEYGRSMYWDTAEQKMYAFFHNSVIRFPIQRPLEPYSVSDLIIEELVINNEERIYFPDQRVTLSSTDNSLSLFYTIIDYEQNDNYHFAYTIDQPDDWIPVGDHREIHLPKLNPGLHKITIRATGPSGFQKTVSLEARVQRPFWQQTWFVLAIMLVVAIGAWLLYRNRIKSLREKANLDRQISLAELKALHAQMNPHFIFNSLNSIREMMLSDEIQEASRYLSKFAHLIRMTLDQSRQSYISLRNTMQYIERYVEMEKIRNQEFEFTMYADKSLDPDETVMPPMLIQPFIENAIWHGMNGEDQPIRIDVRFAKEDEQLICVIEDDGIGIRQSLERKFKTNTMHSSVSIHNIEQRIALLNKKYKLQSHLTIKDKQHQHGPKSTGTTVTISLPLEITES